MPVSTRQGGSYRIHAAYLLIVAVLFAAACLAIYNTFDIAVTLSYRDQELYEQRGLNAQVMKALPVIAEHATREQIIEALREGRSEELYIKHGCVWVGFVGLKFDVADRLEHVSPAWSSGGPDPCFPE